MMTAAADEKLADIKNMRNMLEAYQEQLSMYDARKVEIGNSMNK